MNLQPIVTSLLLLIILVLSAAVLINLDNGSLTADSNPDTKGYTYIVVQIYPHDTKAFTQGLIYADDYLYEGTGLYGQSSLRQVELSTGNSIRKVELPSTYFGEGITAVNDTIIQLTWTSKIGFIYN